MSYQVDKPNFQEFWVKMAKMTLKVKVNDPYFQYQTRVFQDACLVQIWWFQLKSVMSYHADKVKFTDGQTDGRRYCIFHISIRWTDGRKDRCSQWQYPFGLKAKG